MPRRIFRLRANQLATLPESALMMAVVRQPRRQLPEHALGIDRIGRAERALLDDLPPVAHVLLDPLAPGAVRLAPQQRRQRAQRERAVALEMDLHRVADAEHLAVDVDLHAARLALGRQVLGIGKVRADHQERVAAHHHLVARPRAEQAHLAGDEGQIVRHRGAAEQRLGDAGAEDLGDLDAPRRWPRARRRRPASRPSRRRSAPRRRGAGRPRAAPPAAPRSRRSSRCCHARAAATAPRPSPGRRPAR